MTRSIADSECRIVDLLMDDATAHESDEHREEGSEDGGVTAAFSGKLSTANGCTSDGKRYVTCWFVGALACAEIRSITAHSAKWRLNSMSTCVAL